MRIKAIVGLKLKRFLRLHFTYVLNQFIDFVCFKQSLLILLFALGYKTLCQCAQNNSSLSQSERDRERNSGEQGPHSQPVH